MSTTTTGDVMMGDELWSPFELWCVTRLEEWYRRSFKIKCPFFRRRAADALDAVDSVIQFVIIRHKSLDWTPLGCRIRTFRTKQVGLSPTQLQDVLLEDWKVDTRKGYYITGRLNTAVYRDDCVFNGPDLDMPVKGLAKYMNAASQLFDYGGSQAELLELRVVHDRLLVAKWRLTGVLRLPWKPRLPDWTGTTLYHRDDDGLIYLHDETWDMSVVQAFLQTLLPSLANLLYKTEPTAESE